jgi:hypothetical protein
MLFDTNLIGISFLYEIEAGARDWPAARSIAAQKFRFRSIDRVGPMFLA